MKHDIHSPCILLLIDPYLSFFPFFVFSLGMGCRALKAHILASPHTLYIVGECMMVSQFLRKGCLWLYASMLALNVYRRLLVDVDRDRVDFWERGFLVFKDDNS